MAGPGHGRAGAARAGRAARRAARLRRRRRADRGLRDRRRARCSRRARGRRRARGGRRHAPLAGGRRARADPGAAHDRRRPAAPDPRRADVRGDPRRVDEIAVASDPEIVAAMRFLFERAEDRRRAERRLRAGGAAGRPRRTAKGLRVGVTISGGNVDAGAVLASCSRSRLGPMAWNVVILGGGFGGSTPRASSSARCRRTRRG